MTTKSLADCMEKFFYPESVVVFGVSTDPKNFARSTIENLEKFGFNGQVYPIGNHKGDLNGKKIFQNIEDVDEVPDLAVLLIPAQNIPVTLNSCGRKGIRHVVIQSAGFSEYRDEHRKLEEDILSIANQWRIRILGPNCLGLVNFQTSLVLPFVPLSPSDFKKGGSVSLISQSGGIFFDTLRTFSRENIGLNKIVTLGNKLDLKENDVLQFLQEDSSTSVIGLHLESISDGRKLMDLAASSSKPIIVLKSNTFPTSREIASFHTSALAGDDEVTTVAMKQSGLHRVQNLREMVETIKMFMLPPMWGNRIAVLTRSGGQGVLLADAAHRYGFEMVTLSDVFYQRVVQKNKAGIIRKTNPVDLGDIDINFYGPILEQAVQEGSVDGVVFNHYDLLSGEMPPSLQLIDSIRDLSHRYQKPIVFLIVPKKEDWTMIHDRAEVPIFSELDGAIKALAVSRRHTLFRDRSLQDAPCTMANGKVRLLRGHLPQKKMMDLRDVFRLLERYGLPVAEHAFVEDLQSCQNKANAMGYPVVLKLASADVLHKTELKGVKKAIWDVEVLTKAYQDLRRLGNWSKILLLQRMVPAGTEVILGGKHDQEFGPVVLFGLGGIYAEILKDITMRIAPITRNQAKEMIEGIKSHQLLKGFRGYPPADLDFLENGIIHVSQLIAEHPEITNLDINPLLLYEKECGGVVVDAKIETLM